MKDEPPKVQVGAIHAKPVRGPHKDGSGRWYWQARVFRDGERHTVWCGWGTPAEVRYELGKIPYSRLKAVPETQSEKLARMQAEVLHLRELATMLEDFDSSALNASLGIMRCTGCERILRGEPGPLCWRCKADEARG